MEANQELETTEVETTAAATTAEEKKPAGNVIYVGPSLSGKISIRRFSMYSGALPAPVQAAVDSDPALASLFVPRRQLNPARMRMRDPESSLAKNAATVAVTYRRA